MKVHGEGMGTPPTRAEVREKILALFDGDEARGLVSDWAARWIREPDPNVEDAEVWEAITRLAGADLRTSPTTFLHSEEDFLEWLKDLGDS